MKLMSRVTRRPAGGNSRLLFFILSCSVAASLQAQDRAMFIDFGGADNQTFPPPIYWNNVNEETGATPFAFMDLVDIDGADLDVQLFIDGVFDVDAVEGGTTSHAEYPASASQDSLVSSSGFASFSIVGNPGSTETYILTFFSSLASGAVGMETTYTVTGEGDPVQVSLEPSGNTNNSVSTSGISPTIDGEVSVQLSPGGNHGGGNDNVYLGIMRIDAASGWSALVDFGSSNRETNVVGGGELQFWNNVTNGVADTNDGSLRDIVTSSGDASGLVIQMVSRFNGVNTAGASDSTLYPASATSDSWYANTEDFGVGPDITPIFNVEGLDPEKIYRFSFYGSRMNAGGDNRQTVFTLTGNEMKSVSLNASENVDGLAVAEAVRPASDGTVNIALTPGAENNNSFHFIYLGAMQIDDISGQIVYLFDFGGGNTTNVDVKESPEFWNNVTGNVGTTNDGRIGQFVTSDGVRTSVGVQMVARFNGINRNGTTESTLFPAAATGDSLFGNTEIFSGLENVFPAFNLTGLDPGFSYDLTFFGSRSATDNRQTRYTVTGANSAQVDLNVSSNIDNTVKATGIAPDAQGNILIQINPGPENNNGNHFTYLGLMRIDWRRPFVPRILIDAGGTNFQTGPGESADIWNNFLVGVAQTDDGVLNNLLSVNGATTGLGIRMISRFNGVNEAGTQGSSLYPASATRDSLFGNVEEWSGLTDVLPQFAITGLDTGKKYDLTFFASRMSAGGDMRQTKYSLNGAESLEVLLDASENIENTVSASNLSPNQDGEIIISMTPGPDNNNRFHFIYLGALQIDWVGANTQDPENVTLSSPEVTDGQLSFQLLGRAGQTYSILGSTGLNQWMEIIKVTLQNDLEKVSVPATGDVLFIRVVR
ncbi:MAG: hypothetical protein LR011_06645 [Verrucomicrobia bacterium]|nr:hypothetical protein [Verrucomicrobiota bacterium]